MAYHYRDLERDEDGNILISINYMLLYELVDKDGKEDGVIQFWKKSGLELIQLNERLKRGVIRQFERMQYKHKKLKGGIPKARLRESWKKWENPYRLKILKEEVTTPFLTKHYTELVSIKAKEEGGGFSNHVCRLFKKVVSNIQAKNLLSKKRTFGELSNSQKRRVKAKIMDECKRTIVPLCETYNIKPVELDIMNLTNNKIEKVILNENPVENNERSDNLNMLCLIKDKFKISDAAYKELSMLTQSLPRFYELSNAVNKLDKHIDIFPTPGTADGVQISFVSSIREKLKVMMPSNPDLHMTPIKVKFSGDGTWIGKRLHVVNFTYTILNEGRKAMSERGNYCLAIIKVKEDYESLRESLSSIVKEMEESKVIDIDGTLFHLEYFLGGDWKFLACVCGIGAATSNYACIWCKCHKKDRGDRSLKWSLLDTKLGARTVDDIIKCSGKQYSVKHPPLFRFILLCNVVIDNLHLFLRISDVLIARLIHDMKMLDSIEKKVTFPTGFNRQLYGHMARYEKFLNEDLKLSFEWRVNKDTNKLEYRDLTGPEKIKLFKHIDITSLLPANDRLLYDGQKVQKLWDSFYDIICMLKADTFSRESLDTLKSNIWSWFNLFLDTYQSSDCTPYIHALVHHIPEFIEVHGNVNFFNQQGLEKFNDVSTKIFFRGTNMRGLEALKQLMTKKCRIQLLEDQGFERDRNIIHCHNCGMTDHNILKCMSQCNNCSETICCRHLEKVGGIYLRKCLLSETSDT